MLYRSEQFSLTPQAVEQMRVVRAHYQIQFPEDPPVVAGILVGGPWVNGEIGEIGVVVAFWRQSEFPPKNEEWKNTVRLAGFDILFDVPEKYAAAFLDRAIDYSPDRAFFLTSI